MFESINDQKTRISKLNEEIAKRLEEASFVKFDQNIKFERQMNVQAESGSEMNSGFWSPRRLRPVSNKDPNELLLHNSNAYSYRDHLHMFRLLKIAGPKLLPVYSGAKKGSLLINGDFSIPMIHKIDPESGKFQEKPHYTFTPNDVFATRPLLHSGISGHVVLSGIRMGYLLSQLIIKPSIKTITVIEEDEKLFEFVCSLLRVSCGTNRIQNPKIGNLWDIAPLMKADWLLVDNFDRYGNNYDTKRRLEDSCKDIKKIWCYGSVKL